MDSGSSGSGQGMDGPDKIKYCMFLSCLLKSPMHQAPASHPVSFPNIYSVIQVFYIIPIVGALR